jgi:drug/metabolite transporter superfamily protein YnfA
MSPEDEQKMEIGQAMAKSFMMTLFGIVLALAEEEAIGIGIAVPAGIWFCVSLRRLLALRPREPGLPPFDPD